MGAAITGCWTEGGGCADVGNVLYSGGAGSDFIWVVEMGHVPTHQEGAGRVP